MIFLIAVGFKDLTRWMSSSRSSGCGDLWYPISAYLCELVVQVELEMELAAVVELLPDMSLIMNYHV